MKLSKLLLSSLCGLSWLGGGKVPRQPRAFYGAIRWSHFSHSESDDGWSEMHGKPPSLLHTSAGMPMHMACGLYMQCEGHLSVSASVSALLVLRAESGIYYQTSL